MFLEVNAKKEFKGFTLNVDFELNNQRTGILGASGSGKSMTLKIISGLADADFGKVIHDGKVFFDSSKKINLKPQQRNVGYLFQNYALFPHMTIYENIAIGVKKNKKETSKIVTELLDRFMILNQAKKYPHQLSGGQQQRVALARIFANDPSILLVDEAFSAMDYFLKEQLQVEFLNTLKDFNGNVLMVTHDMDELYNLCDNVIVLHEGKSVCFDTTKNVFNNPKLLSVAKLTGCRNFSKIEKLDDKNLFAKDWGLNFRVSSDIHDNIDTIGIRENFFKNAKNSDEINSFNAKILDKTETHFEYKILCSPKNSESRLWWKTNKIANEGDTVCLSVNPEDIMLLHNDIGININS